MVDLSFTPLGRGRQRRQAISPDFGMIIAGVSARQAGSATARAQAAMAGGHAPSIASFNEAVAALLALARQR